MGELKKRTDRYLEKGPEGRPKGLVAYLKSKTNNAFEAADLVIKVMRGETLPGLNQPPGYFYRIDAAKYIIERSWGSKAPLITDSPEDGQYDIHQILLVHLQRNKDKPGMFSIPADQTIDISEDE